MRIRPLSEQDLSAIEAIQALSPETPRWPAESYRNTRCLVAAGEHPENSGEVLGFAAGRQTAPAEAEILNLAVHPSARRRGVARALLRALLETLDGEVFLEVRASNLAAIALYESLGFSPVGTRSGYYAHPPEDGVVLKFHPC